MLKIATVLFLLAAIACHAAPRGWRSSEAGRTNVSDQPTRNSLWREPGNSRRQQGQLTERDNRSRDEQSRDQMQKQRRGEEEEISEGQQENYHKEVRKTNWQYEIAHVQDKREREMKASQQGARRGSGRRLENESSRAQEEEEEEEEENSDDQGADDNQQGEDQSNQQEDQQEVDQIDQRNRAENQRQRQENGRESASRDSRQGRNEQQRNGNRQTRRRGGSQKVEQINEQEDQIQEEQEVNEENRQEGSQEENNEASGLPNYEFSYGVNDPDTGDHKDQWEKRVGDHLEGGYVLDLPDGTKRVVHYKNDGKRGFETNIMQIERKKASEKSERRKKEKAKNVAHSYSKLKQTN